MSIKKYIFVFVLLFSFNFGLFENAYAQTKTKDIPLVVSDGVTISQDENTQELTGLPNLVTGKPSGTALTAKRTLKVVDLKSPDCSEDKGLFNRIVTCTQGIMQGAVTDAKIKQLYTLMQNIGSGAVVLYIMFFGIKLMFGGVSKVRTEAAVVLSTAIFIVFFNQATQVISYKNVFIDIQNQFVDVATRAIDADAIDSLAPGVSMCADETFTYKGQSPVWRKIDCLIPEILGAHPVVSKVYNCFGDVYDKKLATDVGGLFDPSKTAAIKSNLLGRGCDGVVAKYDSSPDFYKSKNMSLGGKQTSKMFSLFVILAGSVFSADAGFFIIITGIFIPVLMIVAFGQAVYVYLTSYIAITIMALFAPLVIPCFLFAKTRHIFDQWLRIIVSMTLKPGILLIYLTFMVYILIAVMNYGGGINGQFRSLTDYLSGKSFENSTTQQVLWGKIESKDANAQKCYTDVKDSKKAAIVRPSSALLPGKNQDEAWILFAEVQDNPSDSRYNERKKRYEELMSVNAEDYKFSKFVESVVDQYYGDVSTDCKTAKQQWKYTKYNFANVNSVEHGVEGIINDLISYPFIASAITELLNKAANSNNTVIKALNLSNNGVRSVDELKLAIINNTPVYPTLANIISTFDPSSQLKSPKYGDLFIEKFQKFLMEQKKEESDFFLSLLIVLIVLAITLSFMSNVIEFGDQMAGLAGTQAMKMSNFYSQISRRFMDSMQK